MITLLTRARSVDILEAREGRTDRTDVKVFFLDRPGYEARRRYSIPEPFQLETDGAIIQSNGWLPFIARRPRGHWGRKILWIIDFLEFKSYFPERATGTHFCRVAGIGTDNEHCVSDNCPRPCKMHVYPEIFCSCDE